MKLLPILLIFISTFVNAEDDCIFDETAYIEFINKYSTNNRNAKIASDGKTLIINRNNEEILVKGGGCIHLGISIDINTNQAYSEKQFLKKVLSVATEFGSWLININNLKNSISNGEWERHGNTYFIPVDAMTVFEAEQASNKINVTFYIN